MPIISKRLFLFTLFILTFSAVLLFRLFDLQILQGKKLEVFSHNLFLRKIPIPAPRGRILDRHGVVLAENIPSFALTLTLNKVKDFDQSMQTLAYLLSLPEKTLRHRINNKKKKAFYQTIPVARDLERNDVAQIRAKLSMIKAQNALRGDCRLRQSPRYSKQDIHHDFVYRISCIGETAEFIDSLQGEREKYDLSGIELHLNYARDYPFGEVGGHLLGYLKEVNAQDLKEWQQKAPGLIQMGDRVGKLGIEKTFETWLRGKDGYRYAWVTAHGVEVNPHDLGIEWELPFEPAQGGKDLALTLDHQLNKIAFEALAEKVGAVVALDPRDGAVLAMVSQPAVDPGELSGVILNERWSELRDHPDHILLHRPLQGAYPPGSTHKIVTAMAALAEGKVELKEKIHCPGHYTYGSRRWGCWRRSGHGLMDLKNALKYSCDVFFYKLGERLGPDRIAKYARMLGLGKKSRLLEDWERDGLIPTKAWKQKKKGEAWNNSDNLGNAIGQGFNLVTPLQNALMMARFANGGKSIQPYIQLQNNSLSPRGRGLGRGDHEDNSSYWGLNSNQYHYLKDALIEVVQGLGGTGSRARVPDVNIGGKTGTAQVIALEKQGQVPGKTEDHAWFVAFAPAQKPSIALAVVVEHGGGGGAVAAPIAQKILAAYFGNQ